MNPLKEVRDTAPFLAETEFNEIKLAPKLKVVAGLLKIVSTLRPLFKRIEQVEALVKFKLDASELEIVAELSSKDKLPNIWLLTITPPLAVLALTLSVPTKLDMDKLLHKKRRVPVVTLIAPDPELNSTSSCGKGTVAPVAPPDVADQTAVESHAPLPLA